VTAQHQFAPRLASVPDTLVYSFQGREFLRDTVSVARSGMARVYDTTYNVAIVYGYLNDVRDGKTYRTVKIGPQVWMAQNLSYAASGECYMNANDSCYKYGRLYKWVEAMGAASTYSDSLLNPTLPRRGVCPEGWHVPSDAEWVRLTDTSLVESSAGSQLKSASVWSPGDGADSYGFAMLPAGVHNFNGSFNYAGKYTAFWTATEVSGIYSMYRYFNNGFAGVSRSSDDKYNKYSIRCLQDGL